MSPPLPALRPYGGATLKPSDSDIVDVRQGGGRSRVAAVRCGGRRRQSERTDQARERLSFVDMLLIVQWFLQTVLTCSLPGAAISLQMPTGWRQLEIQETQSLKPKLKPENKIIEKMNDRPPANVPLIAIKHDYPLDTMAATVQLFAAQLPKELHGASSLEATRVIAAVALAAFRGKYEVEPREITVAGLRAAEWVVRYELTESSGAKHDMRVRSIVITTATDRVYQLGYSGPAADTADFQAFEEVVRSFRIERLSGKR